MIRQWSMFDFVESGNCQNRVSLISVGRYISFAMGDPRRNLLTTQQSIETLHVSIGLMRSYSQVSIGFIQLTPTPCVLKIPRVSSLASQYSGSRSDCPSASRLLKMSVVVWRILRTEGFSAVTRETQADSGKTTRRSHNLVNSLGVPTVWPPLILVRNWDRSLNLQTTCGGKVNQPIYPPTLT